MGSGSAFEYKVTEPGLTQGPGSSRQHRKGIKTEIHSLRLCYVFHREPEAPKLPFLEVTVVSKCLISADLDQSGGSVWSPVTLGVRGRAVHTSGRSGGRRAARGTPSQVTQPTRPELLWLRGKVNLDNLIDVGDHFENPYSALIPILPLQNKAKILKISAPKVLNRLHPAPRDVLTFMPFEYFYFIQLFHVFYSKTCIFQNPLTTLSRTSTYMQVAAVRNITEKPEFFLLGLLEVILIILNYFNSQSYKYKMPEIIVFFPLWPQRQRRMDQIRIYYGPRLSRLVLSVGLFPHKG